jgi:hypothetical protein
MKNLLTIVLVGFLIAGCSPAPNAQADARNHPASLATGIPATETGGAGGSTSSSNPLAITVRPPAILLGPIQGTPVIPVSTPTPVMLAGWQTFTSPALGVAVDYPGDWSASENADGIAFTSPQGLTVRMQANGADGSQMNSKGGDCSTLINSYSETVEVCVDSSLDIYSASINLPSAEGDAREVILSTTGRTALDIYKGMLDSLRPAR